MRRPAVRFMFLALLLCLAAGLGLARVAGADRGGHEAPLDAGGSAYEINRDAQGQLWISDFDTGHVWGVDPATGAYEVYAVLGAPSDARQAGGWLWWADGLDDIIGRVATADGSVTRWKVPGATGFYGTALDADGRLWAVSADLPRVYRLDADAGELCTYDLPGTGRSTYIVMQGTDVWLAAGTDPRVIRLRPAANEVTSWALPAGSFPMGLAVDGDGRPWFVDSDSDYVAWLNPDTDTLTRYAVTDFSFPTMLAFDAAIVWYTAPGLPGIGRLDPAAAASTTLPLTPVSAPLTPACAPIAPAGTGSVTITNDDLNLLPRSYVSAEDPPGVEVFDLPFGAYPWGLALEGGFAWAVDQGRQVLVKLPLVAQDDRRVYLPIIIGRLPP